MNIKQIYRVMAIIDTKFLTLTKSELLDYQAGSGILTILEEAINTVLFDKQSIENFWKNYQAVSYDGIPYNDYIVYDILSRYFFAAFTPVYNKLMQNTQTEVDFND